MLKLEANFPFGSYIAKTNFLINLNLWMPNLWMLIKVYIEIEHISTKNMESF